MDGDSGVASAIMANAFATHKACYIQHDYAFCAYPWVLYDKTSMVLTQYLSFPQKEELLYWLEAVGGSLQECLEINVDIGRNRGGWRIELKANKYAAAIQAEFVQS